MTNFNIPVTTWLTTLTSALQKAEPGDTVIVRTEPMLRFAEAAAKHMGKKGVDLVIADKPEH